MKASSIIQDRAQKAGRLFLHIQTDRGPSNLIFSTMLIYAFYVVYSMCDN